MGAAVASVDSVVFRPMVDNVHGTVYLPGHARVGGGVIVIGGSGGREPSALAEAFARAGIPAFSIAYFGQHGLPSELRDIPLEYFRDAVAVLRDERSGGPVVLVGTSRGSEAAMLTAAHFGAGVAGAVVTVPADVAGRSSWTLEGTPVPEEPIPVDAVPGQLLLVSAGADEVWPSAEMARSLAARRRPGDHELLEYPEATHALGYLVPDLPLGLLARDLGDSAPTRAAREDAFPRVVRFVLGLLSA